MAKGRRRSATMKKNGKLAEPTVATRAEDMRAADRKRAISALLPADVIHTPAAPVRYKTLQQVTGKRKARKDATTSLSEMKSPMPPTLPPKPSPTATYIAMGHSPQSALNLKNYGIIGFAALRLPDGRFPSKYLLKKFSANRFKLLERKPRAARAKRAQSATARASAKSRQSSAVQEMLTEITALRKASSLSQSVISQFTVKTAQQVKDTRRYQNRTQHLKRKVVKQDQTILALRTTIHELRAEIRAKLGLEQCARPISNAELAAAARKNIMINQREYSLKAYETFRDVVCGAGLHMNQVKFVTNVMFELITGVKGDFKVSRTAVGDAIMSLDAADDADEIKADSMRKHQLIFDESAHIMLLASAHWNALLSQPELTVLAAVRLDKQTGLIVATLVNGLTVHIPAKSIVNALSDNCTGMEGKYKGAMVCLFRLLKARGLSEFQDEAVDDLPVVPILSASQSAYTVIHGSDSEPSDDESDAGSYSEVDSDNEDLATIMKSQAAAKSDEAFGTAAALLAASENSHKAHSRHTRSACMTHLGSIMHDSALVAGCGKAPGYKQGAVKVNHVITYLLQQHYIWDANRVAKLLVCKDLCGVDFSHQTTEPDLNRWLYTFLADTDAVDPDFQFKSTMYYMAATTKMRCHCGLDNGVYQREEGCECTREWLSDKANSKEARQLLWFGCLSDPKKGAVWSDSVLVRLQLLAEYEFSTKVINPFHHWTIGQESVEKSRWRCQWSDEPWLRPDSLCEDHSLRGHHIWRQLPAGWQMCGLSRYVRNVLQCCDDMEAAVKANCWTRGDVLRLQARERSSRSSLLAIKECGETRPWECGVALPVREPISGGATVTIGYESWGRSTLPSQYETGQWPDLQYQPGEMWCPLEDTVIAARQSFRASVLPGGRSSYRRFKVSMKKWIQGYITSCRNWLPRLTLLPFVVGELEDPVIGPPLARALIRRVWLQRHPLRVGQMVFIPKMYRQFGPLQEEDSAADTMVLESIRVQAQAEYHDVFESTAGPKKVKIAAAALAMQDSIDSGCIDTFRLLEEIEKSEQATREFYLFASFGSKPGLYGRICPSISQYPALNAIMNEHVRSLLVTQQQVEAMFNKYRLAAHKRASDGFKAAFLKWKQNNWKRKKTFESLQMIPPCLQRTKDGVIKHYKSAKARLRAAATGASGALKRLMPHIGRSWKQKRSKESAPKGPSRAEQKAAKEAEMEMLDETYRSRPVEEFLPEQHRKWREKRHWTPPEDVIPEQPRLKAKKAGPQSAPQSKQANISLDYIDACESGDFTEFLELQRESWREARPGLCGELFCVCRTPYDDDQEYIGCDGVCDGWFHPSCIGMTQDEFDEITDTTKSCEPWYCDCCAKKLKKTRAKRNKK